MFWRCILFESTQRSSVLRLLTVPLAKAEAYYGLFQTTNASALATPLRKLQLTEMCPREPHSSHWFDHPHTWLTQLQLQTQPLSQCQSTDVQLLTF